MRYMLLIYGNETAAATMSSEDEQTEIEAYNRYTEDLRAAGVLLGGEALLPTSAATTVRLRNGDRVVTHGPFAETTEQLGGFYMIDCADLDQALEWAAKVPGLGVGTVEVRPIVEWE